MNISKPANDRTNIKPQSLTDMFFDTASVTYWDRVPKILNMWDKKKSWQNNQSKKD